MIEIYEKTRTLSLGNYKGKLLICPNCGQKKFKPYARTDGSIESEKLGRCQREVNCAYHLKPKDYFKDKGESFINSIVITPHKRKEIYFHDEITCKKFIENYKKSTLFQYLQKTGVDFSQTFEKYKVGATDGGTSIFFQFDGVKFKTGKLIHYLENGKRYHDPNLPARWLHRELKNFDENTQEIDQCFFGRHLLNESDIICIVESEKTALICSAIFGGVWMACGGRTQLHAHKLAELSKKKVFLFPDTDSFEFWGEKIKPFGNIQNIDTSKFNIENKKGADLADFILNNNTKLAKQVYLFVKSIIN